MTAKYLQSDFQRVIVSLLEKIDRGAIDFFVSSPFVIDCRSDAIQFRSRLTTTQLDFIDWQHASGKLHYVSELARPGKEYACEQLRERFAALDSCTAKMVIAFRRDWMVEKGRRPGQRSKQGMSHGPEGVDIILPVSGIRIMYDASSLMLLA